MLAISGIYPESYLGPEPVRLAQDPTDPLKKLDGWFDIPTVREYFEVVEFSASKCLAEFRSLSDKANKLVDELDDGAFNEQTNKTLKQLKEETPIRVLKGKVTDEEYQRLLKLLA